jgi:hypothetical protein
VYQPDPTVDQRRFQTAGKSRPTTTLWYEAEAFGPKHLWWLGYAKAMADFGGPSARVVNLNAFYYKPLHQAGAVQSAAYKYETQGCIAHFSQARWTDGLNFSIEGLSDEQWNKVCDRIDFTFFSWAGDDVLDRPGYTHTGEPDYSNQLRTMRQFGMGTRRGEYTYEDSPSNYCLINATTRDEQALEQLVPRRLVESAGWPSPRYEGRSVARPRRHGGADALRRQPRATRRRDVQRHGFGVPSRWHPLRARLRAPGPRGASRRPLDMERTRRHATDELQLGDARLHPHGRRAPGPVPDAHGRVGPRPGTLDPDQDVATT